MKSHLSLKGIWLVDNSLLQKSFMNVFGNINIYLSLELVHRLVKLLEMTVCEGWHQVADLPLFVLLLW